MDERAADSLVARVNRLERENRRLKRIVLSAGVLLAAGVLLGPAPPKGAPKILKAREFQVVDDDGATRVALRLEASGEPRMTFSGAGGSEVLLGLSEKRLVLTLKDAGQVRASLEAGPEGTQLRLESQDGKRAAKLRAGGDLGLFVNQVGSGRHGASLAIGDSGPALSLSSPDEAGAPILGLQISPALGPILAVTRGSAGVALNVSRDDDPSVTLTDSQGRDRAVLGVTKLQVEKRRWDRDKSVQKQKTEPSSLVLFAADQTVVWKSP